MGAHVGADAPLMAAEELGADVIQIFLSNPQSWKKPAERTDAAELASSEIPIYVHAPYLINAVTANNRVRIPSRKILQETCDAAGAIGAAGVVVHGGQVTGDGDMDEALPRWRKALEAVDTDVPILIENTAGGDNAVARRVEDIRRLWEEIGDLGPGFVLDTCHSWAGGEPFDELVERIVAATGRVDLIHCNDSRDPFDSRRDRHANLGAGEIPEAALRATLCALDAPIVIETPGGREAHLADLNWIRSALAGS
ncbi:MAG TPA: deoxyribonuclease IV [Acidimicrobiia bacterium]